MERTAIFGPPGSGKAGRVVAAVRDGAQLPGGAFLVVGNLVDRSRFLRELAATGSTLLDIEVGTWSALAERIAASPVRRPDAAMERVLVRQALEQVPALAASLRWRGFAETARHHVVALRRAAVWGGDARGEAIAHLPGGDVAAWDELVQVYGELLRQRRLFDDAWTQRRMRQRIDAGNVGIGTVVAYQTLAPTRLQVRMLDMIAQHVPVTASLPWRGGRGLHDAVAALRTYWYGAGWRIETTERSSSDDTLEWFASELFEPSPSVPPSATEALQPAPLAFVECSGPTQVVEEIVSEVGKLLADGVPIGSIAVTAANPQQDAPLLQTAFRRAGIPLATMVARRTADVPTGRMFRDLLAAVLEDDPAALIAALGGTGSAVPPRTQQLADAALRGAGRVRTIADALEIPAVLHAIPITVRDLVDACRGEGIVLDRTLDVLASLLPPDEGALRLLTALAAVLESLAAAAGSRTAVGLDEIVAAVDGHQLRVPDRVDDDHVVLARILDLGTTRFDAVIVYGLHHGGFSVEAEREHEQAAAARDLAHLAVTRARRALRFIRQHADAGGGVVAPHTVWLELERLAHMLPAERVSWRQRGLGSVVPAVDELVFAADAPVSVARAIGEGQQLVDVPTVVRDAILATDVPPAELRIHGAEAAQLAGMTRIAATEIEAYARCPVQWLLRRELPLQDLDSDRTGLDAGTYAHVLLQHTVQSLLAREASGVSPEQVLSELRDQCRRIARVDGELHEHELLRVEAQVLDVLRGEIDPERTRPIRSWFEVQLDSRPALHEVDPAAPPSRPPWPTPGLDIDGVEVHGRVDRIDEFETGLVLHDYKSSSKKPAPAKLVSEGHLQLGLYWLAIERVPDILHPIAAPYRALPLQGEPWGLRSTALKTLGLISKASRPKDDLIREVLDATEQEARRIIGAIRAGELDLSHIDPHARTSPCSHCSLHAICRIEERHEVVA